MGREAPPLDPDARVPSESGASELTTTYREADLAAKYIAAWRDDDFAVFNYPPKWAARYDGANDTTRLILEFKEANPAAIAKVIAFATRAYREHRSEFERYGLTHVAVSPTSVAGERNEGCEQLAGALASTFGLNHLPGALVRTTTVPASHLGGGRSIEEHVASMRYGGPALASATAIRPSCSVCGQTFRGMNGLKWHREHIHGLAPVGEAAVLLVDDVLTQGRTAAACRQVLAAATTGPVVGFFVGKTRGW